MEIFYYKFPFTMEICQKPPIENRSGFQWVVLGIPKGKGEYKKIGTTNILGKKANVVEWIGKEIESEYWERNSCYKN